MTELKCPIHDMPLEECIGYDGDYCCRECGSNVMYGSEELWQALIDTKKKLDICVKALNKIANTDIKVIEREPWYYARAMFSVTNNVLERIRDIEQINKKEEK